MPRKSNPALAQRWIERFARYHQAAMTVEKFCRSEHVSVANFYCWKHKLANQASAARKSTLQRDKPKFVPLQVQSIANPTTATLTLPAGLTLQLPTSAPRCELTQVLLACIDASANSIASEVVA